MSFKAAPSPEVIIPIDVGIEFEENNVANPFAPEKGARFRWKRIRY